MARCYACYKSSLLKNAHIQRGLCAISKVQLDISNIYCYNNTAPKLTDLKKYITMYGNNGQLGDFAAVGSTWLGMSLCLGQDLFTSLVIWDDLTWGNWLKSTCPILE